MRSNYLEVFASSLNVLRSRVGVSTIASCVRVFSNIIILRRSSRCCINYMMHDYRSPIPWCNEVMAYIQTKKEPKQT